MASVYLDTHIIPWLFEGDLQRLSVHASKYIEGHDLVISPMVLLELKYLHEINKISVTPHVLLKKLADEMGMSVCSKSFSQVIEKAMQEVWTRDPFDRLITAHAAIDNSILITKDETIRKHYRHAVW